MPSTGERLRTAQAWHRHQNFVRMMEHLRTHPCTDCGEPDPVVLDFDHLPGTDKRFEIARAVNASTRGWPSILSEIQKCEVVCANCHRRRATSGFHTAEEPKDAAAARARPAANAEAPMRASGVRSESR